MAMQTGNSGRYNISTQNPYIEGYVEWTEQYDDSNYLTTNQSYVTQIVYLHRTNIYSGTTSISNVSGQKIFYFGENEYVNSNNITASIPGNTSSSGGSYSVIAQFTAVVQHDNDGSKNLDLGYYMTNSLSGAAGNAFRIAKTTSNVDLMIIPRANTITASSPYIGDSSIITINKANTDFTSTVTYEIGNITGTIATKTNETVLQLPTASLKNSIYALIPNDKSIQGTIYCTTYNGDTQIGTMQSTTFYLYAKENECKPNVSGTVIDTNNSTIILTGSSNIIVKNASQPQVTITASANYSATISSYLINLNDGQTNNTQQYTFPTINSNIVTVTAVDSRGYSNSYNIDLTDRIIDYVPPIYNSLTIERLEDGSSQVLANLSGTWFNGDFQQSVSNVLTMSFYYKESDDANWTNGGTIVPTIDGNTFSLTNYSLGNSYSVNNEYQFKIVTDDLLNTIGNETSNIQTVTKGVAVVEIGDEFVNINGTFTVNDLPVGGSIVDSGTNNNGSYIKFSDGTMICWGEFTATTSTWGTSGSLYYYNVNSPTAFPQSFISRPPCCLIVNSGDTVTYRSCAISKIIYDKDEISLVDLYRTSNYADSFRFCWLAIGKWQ